MQIGDTVEVVGIVRDIVSANVLVATEDGHEYWFQAQHVSVVEESQAGPPAAAAPVNVDIPYVGGTGVVGENLTCTMGNWEGEPTSYAYQWMSDGTTPLGTGDAYVIAPGDAGHLLTCVVTATNAAGSTVAPPSNAVAVPATPPGRAGRAKPE